MHYRRAVIRDQGEVTIEDGQLMDQIPDGGVVARALTTAISAGTERMWYRGEAPALKSGRRSYPYFPGYSFYGEIVAAGEGARAGVGERVFAMASHASHVLLEEDDYWLTVPDTLNPEDAVGISLTGTGVHATHRGGPELGATVVVIGLGVVGILLAQTVRAAGAATVIGVSSSALKRNLLCELGFENTVAKGSGSERDLISALTEGRGADVVFECTGRSSDVELACQLIRSKGRLVSVGMHLEPFRVSGEAMFAKELTILGSRSAGDHAEGENNRFSRRAVIAEAARLISDGQVVSSDLTTHRFPYEDIKKAYDLVNGQGDHAEYLQVTLEWDG